MAPFSAAVILNRLGARAVALRQPSPLSKGPPQTTLMSPTTATTISSISEQASRLI